MDAEIPTETLSLNEYAESIGVHPRTVKRWLANEELPAAFRDPFSKEWRFPPNTMRVQRATDDSQQVAVSPANAGQQMLLPPQWFPHPGEVHEDEPTRLEMLDEESAFLTVERAAKFLGVPQAQIRANAETFNLMPVGINGSLMVPKSTIRRFEGK
jgi:plasmid maintenance system antidote protein VapI